MRSLTLTYKRYELCPHPRVSGSSCPLCMPVFPCLVQPTPSFPCSTPCFLVFLVWKSVVWPRPGAMPSRRSIKIVDHNQGWHPAWRLYVKIVSLNTDATLKNWLWSVILIFGMELISTRYVVSSFLSTYKVYKFPNMQTNFQASMLHSSFREAKQGGSLTSFEEEEQVPGLPFSQL